MPGATPAQLLANASATADAAIAQSRSFLPFIDNQPLYPTTTRTNVTGRVVVVDGRPASRLWVLLTTVSAADVYTIKVRRRRRTYRMRGMEFARRSGEVCERERRKFTRARSPRLRHSCTRAVTLPT